MTDIYLVTEDELSETVGKRLVQEFAGRLQVAVTMGRKGAGYIRNKLPGLVRLAPSYPVLIITDLDSKECAPTLLREWAGRLTLPEPLLWRVAVREVESWLLADTEAFADFASVPRNQMPRRPDTLPDPKQHLLNCVARYAPRPLKQEIVVNRGAGPKQGLNYNGRLSRFVTSQWRPSFASSNSDSLSRTLQRMAELAA